MTCDVLQVWKPCFIGPGVVRSGNRYAGYHTRLRRRYETIRKSVFFLVQDHHRDESTKDLCGCIPKSHLGKSKQSTRRWGVLNDGRSPIQSDKNSNRSNGGRGYRREMRQTRNERKVAL